MNEQQKLGVLAHSAALANLGLKRYRIALTQINKEAVWRTGSIVPDVEISAFSRSSAWAKFITQRFGTLKPARKDYSITEIKA